MIDKLLNVLKSDIHFKDILKGSSITFILKISGMIAGYFLIYIISDRLGAEGVGFFNFLMYVLILLSMFIGLGMNISVLRYVGQFNNEHNLPKIKLLYKYFMMIVSPLAVIVSFILYFSSEYLVDLFNKESEYAEGLKIIGIILPFYSLNQISIEYIRGLKQLHISELVRSLLRPVVMCLGIFIFFGEQLTKIDLVYLLMLAVIVNFLVSQATILNKTKRITSKTSGLSVGEFLKTSLPMMITSLSSTLFLALPIFFLDFYSSQAEVGIYSVANRLASLVSIILIVINTIAAPKFSELYWGNNMKELQKVISQSTKLMFWVAFIISIALIIFGKMILGIFGEEFKAGYYVLVILVISQLINAATGSVGVFMNMTGRQKTIRNVFFISVLALFISFVILGDNLNMLTASIAFTFLQITISVIPTFIILKELKLKTYFTLF